MQYKATQHDRSALRNKLTDVTTTRHLTTERTYLTAHPSSPPHLVSLVDVLEEDPAVEPATFGSLASASSSMSSQLMS